MGRHTANTQSSASTQSQESQSQKSKLLTTKALRLAHKAAILHFERDGSFKDPKEVETVALWEDLYNKVLLKGYSNNSQWPPNNRTDRKMDICTHYFAHTLEGQGENGLRRLPLIFTEAKRARNVAGSKGEALEDCEKQLYEYCRLWMQSSRPKGTEDALFANAVVGGYIRCFVVTRVDKNKALGKSPHWVITMKDLNNGEVFEYKDGSPPPSDLKNYMDVEKAEDSDKIIASFKLMREKHKPEPEPPRPSTPSTRPGTASQESSPQKTGSPMNIDVSSSAGASPSAASTRSRASSPAPSGPSRARSPAAPRPTVDRRSGSPEPRATNATDPKKVRQRSPLNNNQSSNS